MAKKDEKKLQEEREATVKLYREQIFGVKLSDPNTDALDLLETQDPEEYRKLCFFCSKVAESPFLSLIVNQLITDQILFISLEAEGDPQTFFGRGSVNGLRVLQERIEKFAKDWDTKFSGTKMPEDAHRMFEPTVLDSDE